jgi:hypothetical protein
MGEKANFLPKLQNGKRFFEKDMDACVYSAFVVYPMIRDKSVLELISKI